MARGILKPYKTYNFVDKDPIIDALRTAFEDTGIKSYTKLSEITGVSATTYSNWFGGKTRRPSHATVVASARGMGKDVVLVDRRAGLTKAQLKVVSSR